MLKPAKMQKVRIYALNSIINELIEKLHELGMVEISVLDAQGLSKGAPLDSYNEISTQLVRMRGIKSNLPQRKAHVPKETKDPIQEAKHITIDDRLKTIYSDISKIQSELGKISEELKITSALDSFTGIDFSKLETKSTGYIIGMVSRENLNKAKDELQKLNIKQKFLFSLRGKEAYLLVLYEKNSDLSIEDHLVKYGFVRLAIPQNLTTPEKYKFWLERETKNKTAQLEQLKAELESLSDKYYSKVSDLEYSLTIAADRAEIASKFAFSKFAFVIQGWMEKKNLHKFEDTLNTKYDGKVFVEHVHADHHELAPTVLENQGAVKPYEFLTESYSLPNSNEIDPSIIYFFTIPLLYGMIVADVIYGLMSIPIAWFFMKKFKNSPVLSSVSRLWLFSAIPAIFFGVIFDEYAGMTHYALLQKLHNWGAVNLDTMGVQGPVYTGLGRLHNLTLLFQVTIIVGMIHLALGFLIGAINEWPHSKKHAIGKLAWIGVEVGGYMAIGTALFNAMPAEMGTIGAVILVISAIIIAWAEGVVGILELPGVAGNVFSYMRIAVVGVVGTILAELINEIFLPMPEQGVFALIFFPIFLILHFLNAFIAMFEAVIQGGRLNIIEFKLKFLKGGGRPFRPFALKNEVK